MLRVISGGRGRALRLAMALDFFTSACSFVEDVSRAETEREAPYVAAVREEAAVGLAPALARGQPDVCPHWGQNFGPRQRASTNRSLSLNVRASVLVVVTWRGHDEQGRAEHIPPDESRRRSSNARSHTASLSTKARPRSRVRREGDDTRMQAGGHRRPPEKWLQTGGAAHDRALAHAEDSPDGRRPGPCECAPRERPLVTAHLAAGRENRRKEKKRGKREIGCKRLPEVASSCEGGERAQDLLHDRLDGPASAIAED